MLFGALHAQATASGLSLPAKSVSLFSLPLHSYQQLSGRAVEISAHLDTCRSNSNVRYSKYPYTQPDFFLMLRKSIVEQTMLAQYAKAALLPTRLNAQQPEPKSMSMTTL
jgi:hypothetical protein